jgi:hypothetical protein
VSSRLRKWLGIAARLMAATLGVWCMAAPAVLGYAGAPATVARIIGPLIATAAIVAINESTRPLRHANLVLGLALAIAAPIAGGGAAAVASGVLTGIAVALLSRVRGTIDHELGGGWRAVVRRPRIV